MDYSKSNSLRRLSHALIPGGGHTYAKGDDQFPELAPGFIARGRGSHVWDVDGNEFIEYGMGLRAVTLGHAYPPVLAAVRAQLELGVNFTRPSPIEVECAEAVLGFVEGAEQVKFTKDGSTATTAAVRLARAHTGRDLVALCADQPFFSYDDWFIGTTPMDAGIPPSIKDLSLTFHFNDLASVERLFADHPGRIAALIMEAVRIEEPVPGFLAGVQDLCRRNGTMFVLDEMITGFRVHQAGAQKLYGLDPDLSCFGKALANGFAVSALVGKRAIMELGGIHHERPRVFLLSTTHGAETHALAACLATLEVYRTEPVIEHLAQVGTLLADGLRRVAADHGLSDHVFPVGSPCNLAFATRDADGQPSQPLRTLFLQETIRRGILMPSLVVSYSHSEADVARTLDAIHGALGTYRKALEDGAEHYLVGPPSKVVFRRYC